MLEEDVAKTGKCVPHKATDEDKKAAKFAKDTLVKKQAAEVTATKAYQRSTTLDVNKVGTTGAGTDRENMISVEDKYDEHYADIKAAYIKSIESGKLEAEYLKENPSARTDVTNYNTEYKKLWELEDVADDKKKPTDITNQKAIVEPLEKKLPKNADVNMLNQAVKDQKVLDDLMKVVDRDDKDKFL